MRPSLGQGADTFRFPRPCTDNGTEADRGVTTASGIHAVPFTAEVMRITGLVPNAMADAWEQVFLSAREDDYMALMEATSAWQNS